MEKETCDECGRDFEVDDETKNDVDEMLCPRCVDGRREDAAIYREEKCPASEAQFESWLADVIEEADDEHAQAETFEARGVLTRNRGLVVRLRNGAEFHVTIVRSK